MSTEENQPQDGPTDNDSPATGAADMAANAPTSDPHPSATGTAASTAPAPTPPPQSAAPAGGDEDDEDDNRSGGGFDFGAILDQYEQEQAAFQEGAVVRGRVVGINERGVMIDFGSKSEGFVPIEEFMEDGEVKVKAGDDVEVLVKSGESPEGLPVLSRADAVRMRAWDDLEKAYQDGTPVRGRIVERVKGGLRVDVDGVAAFLPGSQIDSRPVRNLDSYRNMEIDAKVIKLNRKRSNVVLSRKAVLDEKNEGKKEETLSNIEEGIIIDGQIKNLTDYGAFVDLGGIDGLLHVTDMSWTRLQNPAEVFRVGDNVQVKVLKFDRGRERVSLGYKQLLPDPWESVDERYTPGSRVSGSIASVTDYGAFVELEPGIEGLVHVSEMSWSKRMKHPSKLVNIGDKVEAVVLGVDPKNRRISLGIKQIQANPWDTLRERYQIGTRVTGRVRNLTDFGAFLEVEEGIDGLVHVTDISHKRIKHPGEALKKGQEVDAVVTNIDTENRRLSLSIKDIEPSSWDKFVTEHRPGDIVHGRISRFANFGAFVELAENLEGLCHVSELSEERVEKPEDVAQVGQEMDFRILRIDADTRKIGLSARAAHGDAPAQDTKSYSTEAKGGMASLGELANLMNFGRAAAAPEPAAEKEAEPPAEQAAEPAEQATGKEPEPAAVQAAEVEAEPAAEDAGQPAEAAVQVAADTQPASEKEAGGAGEVPAENRSAGESES